MFGVLYDKAHVIFLKSSIPKKFVQIKYHQRTKQITTWVQYHPSKSELRQISTKNNLKAKVRSQK